MDKTCGTCGIVNPACGFCMDRTRADGLCNACRDCRSLRRRGLLVGVERHEKPPKPPRSCSKCGSKDNGFYGKWGRTCKVCERGRIRNNRTNYKKTDKYHEQILRQKERRRVELRDGYVVGLLGLGPDPPQLMIDTKRLHLQLLRKIKELTNENAK